jgi:hypothetical protein
MNGWDRCNGPMFFQFSKEGVMRSRLKLLRNLVIASGIIVALGFGANEASGCVTCEPPLNHSCAGWPDGDAYCNHWCKNIQDCEYGGMCLPSEFCVCLEK